MWIFHIDFFYIFCYNKTTILIEVIILNYTEFFMKTDTVNFFISVLELFFMTLYSHYICFKIINKNNMNIKNRIIVYLSSFFISVIAQFIREKLDLYYSNILILFELLLINSIILKSDVIDVAVITVIASSVNYIIYIISLSLAFIPNALFKITNDCIGACIVIAIYSLITLNIFKIRKLKNGMVFLYNKFENSYYNIFIVNICMTMIFLRTIIPSTEGLEYRRVLFSFIIFSILIIITIRKSFDLYYKQKLLVKDLEQTKVELEAKKQEIDKLEKENLEFSKTSHSLAHKQKALEFKLEQLMKIGTDTKSKEVIKQEIEEISKELYKEPETIELSKTEIESIDNMFSYMQSECIKENIKFELQVTGNIFYMINNLISENDLQILIADHIKDAIIAINHSDNSNRSILVRIGKIDGIDSLYIYDSGIEFEKEVLDNLGKKPITTHADSGGTGMGFMNTFDTLNKTKASLTINEIGKPCIDNYTKVLMFKFDGQNEFKVDSYKNEVAVV